MPKFEARRDKISKLSQNETSRLESLIAKSSAVTGCLSEKLSFIATGYSIFLTWLAKIMLSQPHDLNTF